jgi:hypothetical protein
MNEADREYGPTPADAAYEHTDIEPTIAATFAVWLTVAGLISAAIVYGTFWLFEGRQVALNQQNVQFPLAASQLKEPQGPRLQTQPFKDVYRLRQAEDERLTSYGWIDEANGVVRIPVDEALRIVAERGVVPSATQAPQELNQVVQDSSSGRTTAPRD